MLKEKPNTDNYINLLDADTNARVLFATDEFFATAENLLNASNEPRFDPNEYCEQGKVLDGWESRRRRDAGHDWCLVELGYRGTIEFFEIDTAFFTGNHAPRISIEGIDLSNNNHKDALLNLPGSQERLQRSNSGAGVRGTCMTKQEIDVASQILNDCSAVAKWHTLLPMTPLRPGYEETRLHYFHVPSELSFTHLRLNYFPDGGVARWKAWGRICVDLKSKKFQNSNSNFEIKMLELSSMELGGRGIQCSNQHYGVPSNLCRPNRGKDMGDGWETARHPDRPPIVKTDPKTGLVMNDLSDWCVLKLGVPTQRVERVLLDTAHFKGNYPESCMIEAGIVSTDNLSGSTSTNHDEALSSSLDGVEWVPLLQRTKLAADSIFVYELIKGELEDSLSALNNRVVSYVRVHIFPDGGLSRVRIYAKPFLSSSAAAGGDLMSYL
uniref:Allantoicase domain-containing protein n=1 Tax=Leptocylindrus danicus TaxID=163516 RepID=A0A7S2L5J2_9STRA